jgi:hypothetical protein
MELRILKGLWELLLHFGAIGGEIGQAGKRKSRSRACLRQAGRTQKLRSSLQKVS